MDKINFDDNNEIKNLLLNLLEGLDFEIHEYNDSDEEYKYLKENDFCITVKDAEQSNVIYIDIDEYELTLTIGAWHSHYDYDEENFNEVQETLKEFINNEVCVFEIYKYKNDKPSWFSCGMLYDEEFHSMTINKLLKENINKKVWPIKGKVIIRYFDVNKTETHEFSFPTD